MTKNIMPHKYFTELKDVGIGLFGFLAIKTPDWFLQVNEILLHADGYYKFIIFLLTASILLFRHKKVLK